VPSTAGPPDFAAAQREAVDLLQQYLRLDTTNPPGNERRAAEFFRALFEREGIECELLDQGGGRANIVARLSGNGSKRPLLLLNHLDVVPADAGRWTVPPFAGEIRDGYVWGRGATDMKGTAICQAMTLILLKRAGARLDRDLIFLGTADEEDGAASGIGWVLANRRDVLRNAELVLNEGAYIDVSEGRSKSWNVATTEKSVLWLRIIATGKAGHGSIPDRGGAITRLVAAVQRILAWQPAPRVIPAVAAYFRELAATAPESLRPLLLDPNGALADPARAQLLLADPFRNACLRSTVAVTGLSGSSKVNVIPGEATATLDCRLLPGDDPDVFLHTLQGVAGDESLRFEVLAKSFSTESPTNTDLFAAILRARDRFEPGVPVFTPPLVSTTDASVLRQAGLVVYGFEAFRISEGEDCSHGDDERLSLANVRFGLEVTYAIVVDVCGVKGGL
jgi:acetylornithine deacetylase/succinyl-diaminopimelate desuccinylase-like protein